MASGISGKNNKGNENGRESGTLAARIGEFSMSYLSRMNRERQARSIDLTFRASISEDEFAEMAENAKWRGCPYCGDEFNVSKGFDGPDSPKGNRYCSPRCVSATERETATMVKTQPAGFQLEGWDL